MDRKTLTIVLSVILIVGFFLPYIGKAPFAFSAYDMVFNDRSGDWEKYLWLLVPIPALFLLIGALNNDRYFISRGLLVWLPLLTLIYIPVRMMSISDSNDFKTLVKIMGYGYWISLAAALFLAFARPRPR
jgi:hypothetical protein